MKSVGLAGLLLCLVTSALLAQSQPLPMVYQPLIPTSVRPGHKTFILTVRGTNFVSGAVVHWNGSPRKTTFVSTSQVHATISAIDVAKAATANVTVVNPGGGTSNAVLFPIRVPVSTVAFTIDGNVKKAGAVAVGNFTSHGNADLAIGLNSDQVDLFAGKGNGLFAAPIASSTPLIPANFLLSADFNGDGKPDLAVATDNGGFFGGSIFLGQGDGTFTLPAGNGGFQGIPGAFGDLNGDGKLDLASVDNNFFNNFLEVYLGAGDGSFASSSLPNFTGSISTGVTMGDFNRDGKLDLAVPSNVFGTGNVLQVYLGNGDGTFQAATDSPASLDFVGVVAADVNGDGILDLIADGSCVYLGKGDGTFTEKGCTKVPNGIFVKQVILGDFNGDGKLDFVALGSFDNLSPFHQVVLLSLGNGDGTFHNPVQIQAGVLAIVPNFFGLAVGDFNNDGKLDIAVGSKNRSFVFLQQ
ncbi:MAG TPA: VCBS repeat-containing protein [Candidatus Sulfotelmatobacter sp.]|nr:VCBS repeat-containing protein [Candidatus Sulfotelmatobacter sp.]